MGFTEAIKSCLNQYVGFGGRAARSEFWFWFLFCFLIGIPASILDAIIFSTALDQTGPINILLSLGLLLPSLAVTWRRLHDTDRSAWWVLLIFIPIAGFIALLVFWVLRGTEGENRFGPDPLEGTAASAPAEP